MSNLSPVEQAMQALETGSEQSKSAPPWLRIAILRDAISKAREALTRLQAEGDGWLPIESAPFDQDVEVRVGQMTFLARLLPHAALTSSELACDQWVAVREGEHPPCWSGGACWSSNEDEVASIHPTHWRPLPAPLTKDTAHD